MLFAVTRRRTDSGIAATILPGVLSWAHVANIAYEQISPIANAIFEVNKAAKNLISMAKGRGGQPVEWVIHEFTQDTG